MLTVGHLVPSSEAAIVTTGSKKMQELGDFAPGLNLSGDSYVPMMS